MEKNDFIRRWNNQLEVKKVNPSACIFIELIDSSVLYATQIRSSRKHKGHIEIYLFNMKIAHIPFESIKDLW